MPCATAAVAWQSCRSCLASSSATASCQQLSHCGDSATPLPGPGHRPATALFIRRRGPGVPGPPTGWGSKARDHLTRPAPQGAGGSPSAQTRLHSPARAEDGSACALAVCQLLGNRVREELILSYKIEWGPTTTAVPREPLQLGIEVEVSVDFLCVVETDKLLVLKQESVP